MRTLLVSSAVATFVSATSLFGAETPVLAGRGPSMTPEGLRDSDWSGIRGAYEKSRHAIVANPDGSHQARNPGQAWLTKFDGRGFTVTPDAGGWSWGLELVGFGEATEVRHDGGKISYMRGDGLTEWFVNDARGLEQGWTLAKRPEQAGTSGLVRLNLAVRGGLRPQVAAEGAGMAFLNKSGGAALTYGGLKAWDADGNTVQVWFAEGEVVGKGLGVVVNDVDARYPITVDPIAQQATLTASNAGSGDWFGHSVAVSDDTVVVGAPKEASKATGVNGSQSDNSRGESGAAYVFVRSGASWSQQAYLKGSSNSGDHFGQSVAVSGDTIVIGAPGVFQGTGRVFIFVRNGTTWAEQTSLDASNYGINDHFGEAVSISGDTVAVGAPRESSSATGTNGNQSDNSAGESGAAYVFTRGGTSWTQQAYLKAWNTGANDNFGTSIAVSGDTLVIGAPYESSSATGVNSYQNDDSASASGAAYVFVRNGVAWGQQAYLKASNTGDGDTFGWSVALEGDSVIVGAFGEDSNASGVNGEQIDNSAQDSGACYVFVRSGNGWSQQVYLKASYTGAGDWFGTSVAMSGDYVIVGAPGEDSGATGVDGNQIDNSVLDAGAAYLFERSAAVWSQRAYLKGANSGESYRFGTSVAVSSETSLVGAPLDAWGATELRGASYVFERSYSLLATATHGQITGAGDYQANTTAVLSVTVAPGYLFTGWTGDATGSENPLSVLMDTDKSVAATFSPDTGDADNDGLTNYQEIVVYGTDPTKQDTDNDGVKDALDALPLDPTETLDSDHDGIGDNTETDDDNDGLSDLDEINIYGTNPKRADSDGDGLSDRDELQVHLTNPNLADTDGDGLNDGAEFFTYHTNPKVGDSDEDGFLDGYEVLTGKSPLDDQEKPALVADARTAIEFTFPAALGKIYRIEASLDLTTWGTLESGIAGNGGQIQRFYTTRNMPKRYFRVEEDVP